MSYAFAAIAVLLGSFGQLCMKIGASGSSLGKALLCPYTIAGFFLYGASSLFWLRVLSELPLSTAYPMLALNFTLVLLLSVLALKEPISAVKCVGTVLIVLGVVMIGKS
ncbi:MAG: multidrug transporter [Dehalococcoidia bacterium]|nr:MAG: multidrug transporter [Dehalococcoidia bacterium]